MTGFIGQIRQEQEKWEELDLDYQLQKEILDQNKGSIDIRSELGKGTEVIIRIPAKKSKIKVLQMIQINSKINTDKVKERAL